MLKISLLLYWTLSGSLCWWPCMVRECSGPYILWKYEPFLLDQEVDDSIEETILTRIAFRTFFVSKWFNFCWWRLRFPFWLNPWPQTGHFIQFKITLVSKLYEKSKWSWSNRKLERYWTDWNGTSWRCDQVFQFSNGAVEVRRGSPVGTFYIFPRIICVFDSSFTGEQYKKNRGVLAWTISGRADFQNSWFEGEFLKILFNRSKMTLNVFFSFF